MQEAPKHFHMTHENGGNDLKTPIKASNMLYQINNLKAQQQHLKKAFSRYQTNMNKEVE